jgi:hypothetical protein
MLANYSADQQPLLAVTAMHCFGKLESVVHAGFEEIKIQAGA